MRYGWFHSLFFALLVVIMYANVCNGQQNIEPNQVYQKIKNSNKYKYGIGTAKTIKGARNQAYQALVNSIQVTVTTSQNNSISEDSSGINQSYSSETYVNSSLKLQGVKTQVLDSSRSYKVMAYVSRKNLQNTWNGIKDGIIQKYQYAQNLESYGLNSEAGFEYYEAYLKAKYLYPESIIDTVKGKAIPLKEDLTHRIHHFLNQVKVKAKNPKISEDEEYIKVPVKISLNNEPVNKWVVFYTGSSGEEWETIKQGEAIIPVYNNPSTLNEKITFRVSPHNPDLLSADDLDFIAYNDPEFQVDRNAEVNFNNIITLNFSIHTTGDKTLKFEPDIDHLSVKSFKWEFGDGTSSNEQFPEHIYDNYGIFKSHLVINGDDALEIIKKINLNRDSLVVKNIKSIERLEKIEKDTINNTNDSTKIAEIVADSTKKNSSYHSGSVKQEAQDSLVKKPPILSNIQVGDSTQTVIKHFQYLKKQGEILLGQQADDFLNPNKCFIIIAAPKGVVKELLKPDGQQYLSLQTDEEFNSLSSFKGNYAIWIQTVK